MLSFLFSPSTTTTTTTTYHPLHLSSNHRVFDLLPVSVRLSVCWSRKATMRRVSGRRGTSASGPRSTTAPPHRLWTETTITTVSAPICRLETRAGCVTSNSLLYQVPSPNFPWSVWKVRNTTIGEYSVADLQKQFYSRRRTLHTIRTNFLGRFFGKI